MAQKIHTLNTKLSRDNTVNCDAYLEKLMKRGYNMSSMNAARIKGTSPSRCGPQANHIPSTRKILRNSSAPLTRKSTPRDPAPYRECSFFREKSCGRNHVPIVESHLCKAPPKIKMRNRSMSPPSSTKESWDRLLATKTTAQLTKRSLKPIGSFSSFDPLRTLHFLGEELKNRLRQKLPHDEQIKQMITSMQEALIRIPKDIDKLDEILSNQHTWRKSRIDLIDRPISPKLSAQIPKSNVACQTPMDLIPDIDNLQKQLESSTVKLELSCKQMEQLSGQLTNEKEELQMLLRAEKETVKALRKQIEHLEVSRSEDLGKVIIEYQTQVLKLQEHIKNLNAKIENQLKSHDKSVECLKEVLQTSNREKTALETDFRVISHKYSVAYLENEKLKAIMLIREKQLNEIRSEMDLLQETVNQELSDLREIPFLGALLPTGGDPKKQLWKPNTPPSPPSPKQSGPNFERIVEGAAIVASSGGGGGKEDGDKNLTVSSVASERNEYPQMYASFAPPPSHVRKAAAVAASVDSSDTSACLREMQQNGLLENYSRVSDETSTTYKEDCEETHENKENAAAVRKAESANELLCKRVESDNTQTCVETSDGAQKSTKVNSKDSADSFAIDSEMQIVRFQKQLAELDKDIMLILKDTMDDT